MNESKNGSGSARTLPDPQVPEKPQRTRYTTEYKLRILEELDRCTQPGQIAAVLRREGLYSSNLVAWRRQRREGILAGLEAKKRGPKPSPETPMKRRLEELERENQRLQRRLERAEKIIEIQKKVSEILGIEPPSELSGGRS